MSLNPEERAGLQISYTGAQLGPQLLRIHVDERLLADTLMRPVTLLDTTAQTVERLDRLLVAIEHLRQDLENRTLVGRLRRAWRHIQAQRLRLATWWIRWLSTP